MTAASEAAARLLRARARTGELWLPVTGSSMGARYGPDSQVLVEVLGRAPRVGEVWAYCRDDGGVVVHRYLRRRGDRLVFRGDAEPRSDADVEAGSVVGRVVRVDAAGQRWRPGIRDAVGPLARAVWRKLSVRR